MEVGSLVGSVFFIITKIGTRRCTVSVEFIAPSKELIPDKCKPNIAKSTLAPL
jgi:hypothetical protein